MFFPQDSLYLLGGMLLFLVANVSFGAAVVVYNSFLPEIALREDRDAVSSRGWAAGYLGGGLLLGLNLLLYLNAARIGLSETYGGSHQPGFCWSMVGSVHIPCAPRPA